MKKLSLYLVGLLACWAFYSPPVVQASCEVQTGTVTYTDGQFIGGDLCDVNGNKKVTSAGGGGGAASATATAADPSYTEGDTAAPLSLTLPGYLRVFFNLISGEDQANNLLNVSGGNTRQLIVDGAATGGVPSATLTDGTGSTFILPVGKKTFQFLETCTGTCTGIFNLYGTSINTTALATSELLCTVSLSDTTNAHKSCIVETAWSYYWIARSGTGGTTPKYAVIPQF